MITIYVLYGILYTDTWFTKTILQYNPKIFKSAISCQNSKSEISRRDTEKGLVILECRAYEFKTK